MHFVYTPEGADPIKWEFDPTRLMSPEVEAIERHTGLTFGQWVEAVTGSSMLALHGLLYVLLKRTRPTLKWDDVQFCIAEIDFELDDTEKQELLHVLEDKIADGSATSGDIAMRDSLVKEGVEPQPPVPAGKG